MTVPPFDRARLQLAADTKEEEDELLALFFHGAEAKIGEMEKALAHADWVDWQHAAHYLKGSAANLGMQLLFEKCKQAEANDSPSKASAAPLLDDIKMELQRIKDYIAS